MTQLNCPHCEQTLTRQGKLNAHCDGCDVAYFINYHCPTCQQNTRAIKACGAVDLWCDTCNELVSKSSAIVRIKKTS